MPFTKPTAEHCKENINLTNSLFSTRGIKSSLTHATTIVRAIYPGTTEMGQALAGTVQDVQEW